MPTTCEAEGKNCGSIPDGCGATLDCGSCAGRETCGGDGVENVCGCAEVWTGDFAATDAASLDVLECVSEITGTLAFHQSCDIDSVSLPRLRRIGQALYFHRTGVQTVELPNLGSVGSYAYFHQNSNLTSLDLRSLESVGAYTYFHGNCALATARLDALATVGVPAHPFGTYLYANANVMLEALDLPALETVGGYLYVALNCDLASLDLPVLGAVGGPYVYVQGNAALPAGDATALIDQLALIGYPGSVHVAPGGSCDSAPFACGTPLCGP